MANAKRKPAPQGTSAPDPRFAPGGAPRGAPERPHSAGPARGNLEFNEDNYRKGWAAFRRNPKVGAVRDALGCRAIEADRLVRSGIPRLRLPSYMDKFAQLAEVANQMDVEEGARAVALGRGLIRTAQAKLGTALPGRTFSPATLSDKDYLASLLAVQKRVEETAADPDQEQQRLRAEASLGKALGGLLDAVVKRLMPNVGDALPTVEDLEALDLPQLTDGEVTDAEIVEKS